MGDPKKPYLTRYQAAVSRVWCFLVLNFRDYQDYKKNSDKTMLKFCSFAFPYRVVILSFGEKNCQHPLHVLDKT